MRELLSLRNAQFPEPCVLLESTARSDTRAGDPVELDALSAVLGRPDHPVYLGSVKTNFGHAEAAAGMAGLIKTALALHYKEIPPSLHFATPNPAIPWANLPLLIPRERVAWPIEVGPRLAGVTGLGISGTNAHVVLEEGPTQTRERAGDHRGRRQAQLLALSAKSPDALRALVASCAKLLESDNSPTLSDVCWTAAVRRTALEHRAVFVTADRPDMIDMLRTYAEGGIATAEGTAGASAPKVAFVCPGQGAQWVGMARRLMTQEPIFLAELERCDNAASELVDWSILEQLQLDPTSPAYRLDRIDVIQPVLVSIAISYAALLRSCGVEAAAIVGHSMGEVAAAYIAGALDLNQAMRVICRRSALMQQTSGRGAMALVELSTLEAAARLAGREDRVSVAVSNSPRSSVISGEPETVQQVMNELERDDVFCRLVKVDVASHSPQMGPLATQLVSELKGLVPSAGCTPLWSTVFGRRSEGSEFEPSYWGRNLRETVRFTDAIIGLLESDISAFIELTPHPILLPSIAQTAQYQGLQATLASCGRNDEADDAFLTALGQLWIAGCQINWTAVMEEGRVVSLPCYPWQRQRYWPAVAEINSSTPNPKLVRERLDEEAQKWLLTLVWKRADLPHQDLAFPAGSSWLVVSDEVQIGSSSASVLREAGAVATMASLDQLEVAIEHQARRQASSLGIIVFASKNEDAPYLPLRVLQSVLKVKTEVKTRLWFATKGGQSVSPDGATRVSVDQAALWGAARVVGEEHPDLWGGLVDFDRLSDSGEDARLLVRHLASADGEDQIAFREGRRYVLRLVPAVRDLRSESFAWRQDAAYLITGGLGDIGLQIARSLAARGVRRLVLMGRTPLPPRDQWSAIDLETSAGRRVAAIRALEAEGVSVHVAAVDVSEESQIREFLDRYQAEAWPPIRGVIHAAVALENSLAAKMDRAAFEKVVASKLRAAQLFDRLLPDLDAFVLFSSIGGFLPHSGIANYSAANVGLDALAYDRRARGLPAVSIAWGPWQGTGLAGGSFGEHIASEFMRQGIQTLAPERCTEICTWLCNRADPFTIVLSVDWERFRKARAGRNYPIFKNMFAEQSAPGTQRGKWAQIAPAERRKIIEQVIRTAVGTVLKIAPSRLDARKVMGTMGLNSLMAMELRNRLEEELERPLSATLAWNYPTIEALVTYLADAEPPTVATPAKECPADISEDIQTVLNLSDEQALVALRKSDTVGRN